jgi:hypothetical protein
LRIDACRAFSFDAISGDRLIYVNGAAGTSVNSSAPGWSGTTNLTLAPDGALALDEFYLWSAALLPETVAAAMEGHIIQGDYLELFYPMTPLRNGASYFEVRTVRSLRLSIVHGAAALMRRICRATAAICRWPTASRSSATSCPRASVRRKVCRRRL